jgi:hypothetical protein
LACWVAARAWRRQENTVKSKAGKRISATATGTWALYLATSTIRGQNLDYSLVLRGWEGGGALMFPN